MHKSKVEKGNLCVILRAHLEDFKTHGKELQKWEAKWKVIHIQHEFARRLAA